MKENIKTIVIVTGVIGMNPNNDLILSIPSSRIIGLSPRKSLKEKAVVFKMAVTKSEDTSFELIVLEQNCAVLVKNTKQRCTKVNISLLVLTPETEKKLVSHSHYYMKRIKDENRFVVPSCNGIVPEIIVPKPP